MNRQERTTALAIGGLAAAALLGTAIYRRRTGVHWRRFQDRVVLITGGSRGLGLELARLWARRGANVAICARTTADLKRAERELTAISPHVMAVTCDVTDEKQVKALVRKVIARWHRVDVLVNNAGTIQAGPLANMTIDDFETTMATHFWGPLHLTLACLPHMKRRGSGRIVNISSIGGEIAVPHLAPYCASKFALTGLSQSLRTELRSSGILVTTVCPGLMRTGSPRNAQFKGRHQAEHAWFSIGDSLPLVSINSRRAARQIVRATRRGAPYVRLSLPAKIGARLHGVFPGLTVRVLTLVNALLPKPSGPRGSKTRLGFEASSSWSPSALTVLSDRAARRNNQMGENV